jgi:hypothetical protein
MVLSEIQDYRVQTNAFNGNPNVMSSTLNIFMPWVLKVVHFFLPRTDVTLHVPTTYFINKNTRAAYKRNFYKTDISSLSFSTFSTSFVGCLETLHKKIVTKCE